MIGEGRIGGWMTTVKGRKVWPLDPRPEDFDPETFAHALSNICRFGGHCRSFYSVAQHSVVVMNCVESSLDRSIPLLEQMRLCLVGLLHDAPEAILGDLVRPLKRALGMSSKAYEIAEGKWCRAIEAQAGLPDKILIDLPEIVKVADDRVLLAEQRDLRNCDASSFGIDQSSGLASKNPWSEKIFPMSPEQARERFLVYYYRMGGK